MGGAAFLPVCQQPDFYQQKLTDPSVPFVSPAAVCLLVLFWTGPSSACQSTVAFLLGWKGVQGVCAQGSRMQKSREGDFWRWLHRYLNSWSERGLEVPGKPLSAFQAAKSDCCWAEQAGQVGG